MQVVPRRRDDVPGAGFLRVLQASSPALRTELFTCAPDPLAESRPRRQGDGQAVESQHESFRLDAEARLQDPVPLQVGNRFPPAGAARLTKPAEILDVLSSLH